MQVCQEHGASEGSMGRRDDSWDHQATGRERGAAEREQRRPCRSSEDLDAYGSPPGGEGREAETEGSGGIREREKRRSYRSSEELDACFASPGEDREREIGRASCRERVSSPV